MAKTVIIGFGNLLMGDDGAGIHLVQKLEAQGLPPGVETIDGGVNSFAVMEEIRSAKKVIIVDAMSGGGSPGDVYRLTGGDLVCRQASRALSAHEFSLLDALYIAGKTAELPPIVLYGIEPAAIELRIGLSPQAAAAVDRVADLIMQDLS
ncbi:MAG: hydrogenase maturation protease [Negativicutes bacterium]|nr:hydrogenase maturation protease [Negativicutes bacterium]